MAKILEERGGVLFSFLVLLAILAVCVIMGSDLVSHNRNRVSAKTFFGITSAGNLSDEEKELLRPMVERKLDELSRLHSETVAEKVRISVREDITPDNADAAVQALRLAGELAKEKEELTRREMMRACRAARHFGLVSPDYKWCQ